MQSARELFGDTKDYIKATLDVFHGEIVSITTLKKGVSCGLDLFKATDKSKT